MDGRDMRRRIGTALAEARTRARFMPLWRRPQGSVTVTAADCLEAGKEPLRRLEPLRRRTNTRQAPAP